jgi:hypothetical protein
MIVDTKNLSYTEVKDIFNKIELILQLRKEKLEDRRRATASSINWDACEAIADVIESGHNGSKTAINQKPGSGYDRIHRRFWPFFVQLRKRGLDLIPK